MTQKMCEKSVCERIYMLKYCQDRYKTHKLCEKAVDACLSALKFVVDWFVTPKMLGDLGNTVFFNGDIDLGNVDLGILKLFNEDMDFVNVNLDNVCLDDDFDDDNLDTIYLVKLLACCNRCKNAKHIKNDR